MKQSHTGPNSIIPLSPHVPMPTGQYTGTGNMTFSVELLLSLTGSCLFTGVATVRMLQWAWTVKLACVGEHTMF
jgi:hypothetical protein